ncbi:MAG: transglutaminase domain-containing protein [Deltaproteobacteria bacterium]|nr:transglutaminase domain-containing protein [Deltaproteobacteria bacterium]
MSFAGVVAVALALALLPLHHLVWRQIMERTGAILGGASASSFGGDIRLTTDTDITLSDEPVLDVTGAPVDYLRGAVLLRYSAGYWAAAREAQHETVVGGARGPLATEIRAEKPQSQLFAPLGVVRLATPSGRARIDDAGVVFASTGEQPDRIWLTAAERCSECAGPRPEDSALPRGKEAAWRQLARSWIGGATTPEQKIAAISARFERDFRYSLESHRSAGVDPVWDFLTTTPVGHCEYFASGMTLLLRASGVPARVATGYRVTEYDPLNHRYVVRQKHAHAWVEAWDPATGWRAADPTPPSALADLFSARTPWRQRAWRWLANRLAPVWGARVHFLVGAAVVALGALALVGVRALLRRLPPRRAAVAAAPSQIAFDAFAMRARAAGVERPGHETLEAFAARVRERSLLGVASEAAADAIERYAAHRYGGAGDPGAVERDLIEAAETIARSRSRP